jgi:hypothetical protein
MDQNHREDGKAGWTVAQWSGASGLSRATTFNLLRDGKIRGVKFGARRLITTTPQEFLRSLAEEAE